jgi:hypothetical protein
MDALDLASSPTMDVTAQADAPKLDDALKSMGGLHSLTADRAERISWERTNVRPSIARRMIRACAQFLIAVLIGVCGTLGWQSFGHEAAELMKSQVATYVPSLAQFVTPTNAPVPRLDADEQQPRPELMPPELHQEPASQVEQHLQTITSDLTAAKKTIEQLSDTQDQLARTQQQMAKTVARLQTLEERLSQKPLAPASTKTAVRVPAPKPAQYPPSSAAHTPSKPLGVPTPP